MGRPMTGKRSGDVTIRPVEPDDLPFLFEYQRDPESVRMAGVPARDEVAFASHWARLLDDKSTVVRAIVAEGRVVGHALSFDREGLRELGYWLDRHAWGRGIATKAVALFLEVEPIRPLHAVVAVANRGSARVLEKCGFARVEDPLASTRAADDPVFVFRLD